MTIPHYKIVEIGGKNLVVFYPQFKDDEGYKIIDLENRFPIELKNEEEYKMFLEAIITSEGAIKEGLKTLADLVDEMSLLAKGPKGDTRFMWVKYADDDKGSGMSDNPDGKKYIGMAFNKDVETPSDDPSDYKWVKYVADYEGLEIGGRNLLPNSEKIVVNKGLERINLTTHIKKGSDLIISGNYRVLEGNPQALSIRIRDIDGNHVDAGIRNIAVNDTGTAHFDVVFENVSDDIYQIILYSDESSPNDNIVEYSLVSLYRSNVPMDWSPAPEDFYELIDNVDKAHVGLSNVQNYGIASQSQAENGTSNNAYMTPLRTKQAIEKLSPNYVIDTEIGEDYILKKYSDGTFELKGHVKRTESLTTEINNTYRTGNLIDELIPIMDDSFKLIYSNAWIMNGRTNTFLAMSSAGNPLSDKAIRYRIMGNNTSPDEDVEFIIGYEAYGTWS